MADWRSQIEDEKQDFIRRFQSAEDRCINALSVLANGNSADNDIGLTYLGHLKSIRDRWRIEWGNLANAENAGNGLTALAVFQRIRVLVENIEGLAHAVEVRSESTGRRPGVAPQPSLEDDPALQKEPESQPATGLPAWVWALPVGLVLLWVVGR